MRDRDLSLYLSPVNTIIIILNVIAFAVLEILGDTHDASFMLDHGATYAPYIIIGHQYWRLLTAMFMHFGIRHIFNNMLVLAFVGDNLERALGKVKYIVIYLSSGILANMVSCYIDYKKGEISVGAGASGAIFGVVGALIWILIANHGVYEDLTLRRVVLFVILSIYLGLQSSTTDNIAHLAGMITGILTGILLYKGREKWDRDFFER